MDGDIIGLIVFCLIFGALWLGWHEGSKTKAREIISRIRSLSDNHPNPTIEEICDHIENNDSGSDWCFKREERQRWIKYWSDKEQKWAWKPNPDDYYLLTPNRLINNGDQYYDGDEDGNFAALEDDQAKWHDVAAEDIDIAVADSGYDFVRRSATKEGGWTPLN